MDQRTFEKYSAWLTREMGIDADENSEDRVRHNDQWLDALSQAVASLFDRVMATVEIMYANQGEQDLFQAIYPLCDLRREGDFLSRYAGVADQLGVSQDEVRGAVRRLRGQINRIRDNELSGRKSHDGRGGEAPVLSPLSPNPVLEAGAAKKVPVDDPDEREDA